MQVTFQPLEQTFCSDVIEFTCSNGTFWVRVTACLPAVGLQVRQLALAGPALHNTVSQPLTASHPQKYLPEARPTSDHVTGNAASHMGVYHILPAQTVNNTPLATF